MSCHHQAKPFTEEHDSSTTKHTRILVLTMASLLPSKLVSTSSIILACLVFVLQAPLTVSDALYQSCGNTGNYTAKSTYESNLQSLLSTLSSNGSATGFYNDTLGQVPDQVFGLILCRGDATPATCHTCLGTATQDVQQLCPYSKSAAIWYDDCLLRYSNLHIFSSTDNSPEFYMWNTQNITDPGRFDKLVDQLIRTLSQYAAYNTSQRFATGEMNFTAQYPKIYGLTQCTRDLSGDQCYKCLQRIMGEIKNFLGKQGGRVLGVRCNLRYEVYSFYNSKANVLLGLPLTNGSAPPSLVPPSASRERGSKKNVTGVVLAVVIPLVTALELILFTCICFLMRRTAKRVPYETNSKDIASVVSLFIDLSTLRDATANFSDVNKLGKGGFSAVYKGLLPDGRKIVVKRLSTNSGQGIKDLKNELVLVANLQHRNLVRLLGVCLEEQEKLLVYEYVPNESLDTILFDPIKQDPLNWGRRYKIICGIARGLLYLHEDSQVKIIHRDLNARNILLDADMNPKISNFGLARPLGGDQAEGTTSRIIGTIGYIAPEYLMRGQFSAKSDAFSFGVLVLEIVTGKKNSGFFDSGSTGDFLGYTWDHWINGAILGIVDPSLGDHYPRNEVLRCIQIGLLCVQEDPSDRPNMSTIVLMLNCCSLPLQVPSKPAFCVGRSGKYSDMLSKEFDLSRAMQDQSSSKLIPISPDEVSNSELEPR